MGSFDRRYEKIRFEDMQWLRAIEQIMLREVPLDLVTGE
jgi:hypothetical protein